MCWYLIPKYSCGHKGPIPERHHRCYSSVIGHFCTPEEEKPCFKSIDRACDECSSGRISVRSGLGTVFKDCHGYPFSTLDGFPVARTTESEDFLVSGSTTETASTNKELNKPIRPSRNGRGVYSNPSISRPHTITSTSSSSSSSTASKLKTKYTTSTSTATSQDSDSDDDIYYDASNKDKNGLPPWKKNMSTEEFEQYCAELYVGVCQRYTGE